MPIYEYECGACGERHDALQKFSDKPLRKCPACGRLKLKKLVSAAAFHLKGTGWYVTDFRDKGKGNGKDKGAEAAGESKTDGKPAEKKAETKAESKSKDGAKPGPTAPA